jgi:hypothetical protein
MENNRSSLFFSWIFNSMFYGCVLLLWAIPILVDYLLRTAFFSFFILPVGFLFIRKNKKLIGGFFIMAAPICILVGLVSQEMTLLHAERLRDKLVILGVKEPRKIYEIYRKECNYRPYCGAPYSIIFSPGEDVKSSSLIVFKFFGRRHIIPLDVNQSSYESKVRD